MGERVDGGGGGGAEQFQARPGRELKIGEKFKDETEAKEFIKTFNQENFCEFVVGTNNKKSLYFCCTHSRKRDYRGNIGTRKGQHYNWLDCKAKIYLYKSQKRDDESLKVTQINLEHSQPVSKEIYKQKNTNYSEEEKEMVKNLNSANASARQIKRVLLDKAKKSVTIQNLKNLISQIAPNETDEEAHNALEEFLESLEHEGGDITWKEDPDGTMKDSL